MRSIHRPALAFVLVALSLVAASCTGGGTPAGDGAGIRYLVKQPEDPAQMELIRQDIAAFSQASGITVQLDALPTDTLRTVLQTQLQSGNGPDVFEYDIGPGFAGALAEAGLLRDLTPAYEQHDWGIYDWAAERVTHDGRIVGTPNEVEEVGIFYNADLFRELGIPQPGNLPELEAAAGRIRDSGRIPFAFGDQEGWEAGHVLSAVLSSELGERGMQDLLSGAVPWTSPAVVRAITLWFQTYRQAGYLPQSPAAMSYDNANSLFYSGQAAMNATGTWAVTDIQSAVDFEVGFMPFPAPDGPGIFTGGLGGGTFVAASTAAPDEAIRLLEHLHSAERGRWQVEQLEIVPAYPVDTSGIAAEPLFQQVLADTAQIAAGQGEFGYNIDILMSDAFNNVMWDGLQAVLTDQRSPQDVAAAMQAASTGG